MFSLFPPFHSSMGFSLRMASGSLFFFFFINLFLFSFSNQTAKAEAEFSNISSISSTTSWGKCNWHQGKWVYDSSYPLYDSYKCPFIDPQFNCQKFGRRDSAYLKYRWQPFSCSLPKFNGLYFLEKYRGKKIMFVGDSISANQFQSLTCMIQAWVPNTRYSYIKGQGLSSVTFQDYGLQIILYKTTYLVDLVYELKVGTVLKLDSIRNGNMWKGMDMLIFNSWHWWIHTGSSQPFDYFEEKNKLYKDMNRMIAYYKGLTTWARWVNLNVDPSKTKVFYQGISPTHYDGRDWQQPLKSCNGQTQPFFGPKYPAGTPVAWYIVKKVLSRIKKPVTLLDITQLSQLRKDAHPSAYSGEHSGVDCSHWCLPGLPDTWNQLLYASLFG